VREREGLTDQNYPATINAFFFFTFSSFLSSLASLQMKIPSPPLFGSPLVTALARSNYTTPSGLSIPGILARCFQEIQDKGSL
jgi:hypothetical protein